MRAEILIWVGVAVLWGLAGLFGVAWARWWNLGALERENRVKIRRLISEVEASVREHVELRTRIVWSCPDCDYETTVIDGTEHSCRNFRS